MACHRQKGLQSTWHVSHVAERYAIFHVKSTAPQLHVRNVFIVRCCSKETWSLNLKLKSMTNVSQLALFPVLDFISNSKITFLGVESCVWIVQVFILSAWWLWQNHQECACPVWGPQSGETTFYPIFHSLVSSPLQDNEIWGCDENIWHLLMTGNSMPHSQCGSKAASTRPASWAKSSPANAALCPPSV